MPAMRSTPGGDRFRRVLGRKDALALAFGAMIGWGWIVLAGTWVESAGALGAVAAFLAGGVAIALIALTYAELASAMPLAGGEHVYSHRALGAAGSFVCTWAILLGYVSVAAFEAVALPTVVGHLFPNYSVGYLWTVAGWEVYASWLAVGVGGAVAMTLVNYVGITAAAFVQKLVTGLILVVGVLFVSGALFGGEAANLEPLLAGGAGGVFAVLIMVPFLFVGFDVIPQAAEEIRLPFREIGTVILVSVAMAVAWYALVALGVALALPPAERQASSLAVADAAARALGGPWAGKLVVLAGIAGILTSWNAFLVGGSRALYALADARMVPAWLAALHPRYKTPHRAIVTIGVLSCLAPLAGRPALVWLVDAGGLGIVVAYAMVALSFLVLRRREPEMERPFRVRRGAAVGWTALVLSCALALLYLPFSPSALVWPWEWGIFLVWSLAGAALYGWGALDRGRSRSSGSGAE